VDGLTLASFAPQNAPAAVSSMGAQGANVPPVDFRASEREYRQQTEESVAGNGYRAVAGDSISRILGTSSPQAIGNFIRANGLTGDRIELGRNYFVPDDVSSYGDATSLGQAALNQGNERLAARAQAAAPTAWSSSGVSGNGMSLADFGLAGATYGGSATTPLSGMQRAQAHALGVYDAGVGALESSAYSFGVIGSPESRAAWAVKTAEAAVNGIRSFVSDAPGSVSRWVDALTGDDPVAIRQATAQGAGVALGVAGGVAAGRFAMPSAGLRTSAVISAERAESFLTKSGVSAARAKDFVESFDGPITARLVRSGEDFSRYTDVPQSTGSFLTKTQFANPAAAVDGLYLGPYGNGATLVQSVSSTGRSIVLEGGVANGGAGIRQTLVVNRGAFQFGTGVRY